MKSVKQVGRLGLESRWPGRMGVGANRVPSRYLAAINSPRRVAC